MDCGLRTADYGLGVKHGLRKRGLSIAHILGYKMQPTNCGLGIKHWQRYKIPISCQVITVHEGNGIFMPRMSLAKFFFSRKVSISKIVCDSKVPYWLLLSSRGSNRQFSSPYF